MKKIFGKKANSEGKFEKAKSGIIEEIKTIEEIRRSYGENTMLNNRLLEEKRIANKFFECDYTLEIEPIQTIEGETKTAKTFELKPIAAFAESDKKAEPVFKIGKGWQKVEKDGKLQVVFDNGKKEARNNIPKTGILHTYEKFINAENPIEYLASIKIGDEIRYKAKNESTPKIGKVTSVRICYKAYSCPFYHFQLSGGGVATYRNFY